MKSIIPFAIISFLAFYSGCGTGTTEQTNSSDLQYILVNRRGRIDTLNKRLIKSELFDSTYKLTYRRLLENHSRIDTQSYELPIARTALMDSTYVFNYDYKLIGTKIIRLEQGRTLKDYEIYKYLYDDPNGNDEEMLIFFEPQLGILIEKAAWWGNYYKLTDNGNSENSVELFYLTEMIQFDTEFFHNWTKAANKR